MKSSGTVVHFVDLVRGSVHCQGAPAKDTEALINAVAKVVRKGNSTRLMSREKDSIEWIGDPCANAVAETLKSHGWEFEVVWSSVMGSSYQYKKTFEAGEPRR